MKKKASLKVLRRVSFYYEALLKLEMPKDAYISSQRIEEYTGISCNQVRQDFFYLGISIGKQKKGYQVGRLIKEIKKILSIDKGTEVVIIGTGRLGKALADYRIFRGRNITVKAMFDEEGEDVGKTLENDGEIIPIMHTDDLEDFLSKNKSIKVALLTIPEDSAQKWLDKLVSLGIKGVINYSPRIIKLPEDTKGIYLVNECIGDSIYKVVYQLNHKD